MKRIYRSVKEKMLAGVCGGWAEYFDIDPTFVRLLFVLLGLLSIGVIIYLIMWIIIPKQPQDKA